MVRWPRRLINLVVGVPGARPDSSAQGLALCYLRTSAGEAQDECASKQRPLVGTQCLIGLSQDGKRLMLRNACSNT